MEFSTFVMGIVSRYVDFSKGTKADFSRDDRTGIYRAEISTGLKFFGSVGSPFVTVFHPDHTEIITL